MTVIPLTDFVHGRMRFRADVPADLDASTAGDLERAGLVRVKLLHRRVDQALTLGAGAELVAGKAPAVGVGIPSSSSPPAHRSPTTTLHLPARGGRTPKTGT